LNKNMPSRDGEEKKLNLKPVAACSPLLLLLLSGAARADLEPFSFGASETIEHQSNLNHTDDAHRTADWLSTTELRAALDQAIGRDRLSANAAVDYTHYRNLDDRNAVGYRLATVFDWSTIGDLSGSIGANSNRRQYVYGVDGGETVSTQARNLETTNNVFARVELGGLARWNLFAGINAMNRNYSADTFAANEERQWSTNFGTRYSTSPDLSFGLTANYTRGEYPNYVDEAGDPASESFTSKSLSATTRWQASGNSLLNASLGYTTESSDLQPSSRFLSGSLNWVWTPPSHFRVNMGLARSTDGGALAGNANSLNDRSLNNTATLGVTYELTAKVSLTADAAYIQRKYGGVRIPVFANDGSVSLQTINGTNNTQRFGLSAHYQPTRNSDLGCGGSRESRSSNSAINAVTPNYTDTTLQCTASINFN
jgi:hypothetical protein